MTGFITLKCPTCGANLRFEKGTEIFTCEHCGNVHMLEDSGQAFPVSYKLTKREWMRVGDYDVYLHEILEDRNREQRLIYINVEYANPRSKNTLSCRRNQWLLFDQENYSYEPEALNRDLYEDKHRPFFGGERFINPKMQVRGWLAFKVPPAAQLQRLQFFTGFLTTHSIDILLDESQLANVANQPASEVAPSSRAASILKLAKIFGSTKSDSSDK